MNNIKPKKPPSQKSPKFTQNETLDQNHKSFVEKQVVEAIGKIDRMKKIRATNVFDNNWRVDIWCELDDAKEYMIPRLKIKYSYFVGTNSEGNIISSDPELGIECK
tara:strand:+ start:778 stop:1095 length:318 start_codon:yes stop_codon:yes gene_type:complete